MGWDRKEGTGVEGRGKEKMGGKGGRRVPKVTPSLPLNNPRSATAVVVAVKVKERSALHGKRISELRGVTGHNGITQCYLPPDTGVRAPP